MLRLLTRSGRRTTTARPRFFRPMLEMLEGRDCPSNLMISISATSAGGKNVQVSGQVYDPVPGAVVTVSLGGIVNGSAAPDSNGSFSATLPASGLGTVTAVATDDQGQSGSAQTQFTVTPPNIMLQVVYLNGRDIQLSGTVNAPSPGGLTVTFTGQATGSTTTDASGRFCIVLTASALGDVSASTADIWGQPSNVATVTLQSNAPQIQQFQAVQDGTTWTFSGYVLDESAAGETVTFGGFQPLQGQTCTVGSNGWFSFTITLPPGIDAIATASVTDWWGLQSQEAQFQVIS